VRHRRLKRLLRSRTAFAGALVVAAFLFCAVFAGIVSPQDPTEQVAAEQLVPPSAGHWLGTDDLGRDVLSRIVYGARKSLVIGILSVCIAIFVGVPIGLVTGYFGGTVDMVVMRFVDIMLAFPSILLAIAIVAVLGPSLENVMVAVGVVNIPAYARQTRASVLEVKTNDYVSAARALGAGRIHILLRTILPNVLSPIIVLATLGIGTAILDAAGLNFLGLGGQPDIPEWGGMLTDAREFLLDAPWAAIAPGAAITLVVLGFNLFGDGLRDVLDPRAGEKKSV
jgi:peptide/nickel transport system permease protein